MLLRTFQERVALLAPVKYGFIGFVLECRQLLLIKQTFTLHAVEITDSYVSSSLGPRLWERG